ncbi:MerR family transcriptional regulator [Alkalihalobacillus oceani]|uniref:MerR family transcriptional regulator n=1 Tax=Halalkalibacter oceani TaxID=1653776 RepID=UPI00203F793B|nr:MerR family transcriptional regulator [Halalkalibacter oceani]MCM3760866.1 MerR family transcriptional regulator [Halalkalibacter oceani]
MLTVKQVAELTGVTVKALYHYHKIGLLEPAEISDNGYRLYGKRELERLQHILFYRELDFTLDAIQLLLQEKKNRDQLLVEQKDLLEKEVKRITLILHTIKETIHFERIGRNLDEESMFKGLNKEHWQESLKAHHAHLRVKYQLDVFSEVRSEEFEQSAKQEQQFQEKMIFAMQQGWAVSDQRVKSLIADLLRYINSLSYISNLVDDVDATGFVEATWVIINDEFYRSKLDQQLLGLVYYLYAAAVSYAEET